MSDKDFFLNEEFLEKVRLIEINTRKIINDVMTGQYKSHFKGHGIQFSEHRVYSPGDDIRHIDWKASARTRESLVKKYEEERELNVLLIIDLSGSNEFSSTDKLKSDITAEIAALLSFAAIHTGDKVGALCFAGDVEKIIPPKKGKNHVLNMVTQILKTNPKNRATNLTKALETANKIMKQSGIVFIISDFLAADFELPLMRLGQKNDVIAFVIDDEKEYSIPVKGVAYFKNPESGLTTAVNTGSYAFQSWLENLKKQKTEVLQNLFIRSRVEAVRISTHIDYLDVIMKFFRARGRKR